jgi:hypothetical protein
MSYYEKVRIIFNYWCSIQLNRRPLSIWSSNIERCRNMAILSWRSLSYLCQNVMWWRRRRHLELASSAVSSYTYVWGFACSWLSFRPVIKSFSKRVLAKIFDSCEASWAFHGFMWTLDMKLNPGLGDWDIRLLIFRLPPVDRSRKNTWYPILMRMRCSWAAQVYWITKCAERRSYKQ